MDMVVYACDPSYRGGRDRKLMVQGQPREKVCVIQRINQALWFTPIILALWETEIRLQPKANPEQKDEMVSEK
jgi:hypothetical protein